MATNKTDKVLNVPTLRFPSFTEEWQKHSLDKLGTTIIGLTYSPSDVVKENGTIVFRSSNIQNGEIDYSDIVRVGKEIKPVLRTKESDILICARNGSSRLIGKNAILKKSDEGQTFGAFMMIYRSKYNKFIRQLLNTKRYSMQVAQNIGARINQITTSDLNNFIFNFPTNPHEQKKIADFLSLLDERIALQSKLIDRLKSLMDGIVVKHWGGVEKKKYSLTELGEAFSVMNLSKEDLTEDGKRCIIYGELFTTYDAIIDNVVSHTDKVDRLTLSEDNDLLFPASTTVDAYSLIAPSAITERGIVLGGDMFGIHISQEHSAEYISLIINAIYRNKLSKYAKGSTIIHLHYGDIKNVEVELPDLKTQLYLVGVVKRLRTKFSIETDYLVKLNKAKQSLLSALFI